ncbi:YrhB domain-containing protein [Chryseobacterium sp. Marseille-Q8038]
MLTDKEMLQIAERYLKRLGELGGESIEVMIRLDDIIKKTYGNIYRYNSKEYLLTGDFNKSLIGNAPFLVEKKDGRVVTFGTAARLEDYIRSYENGTMTPSLDLYWYPDEDRFDYK